MASNQSFLLIGVQAVLQELITKVEYISSQQQVGKTFSYTCIIIGVKYPLAASSHRRAPFPFHVRLRNTAISFPQ